MRILVFASGRGSNFEALLNASSRGVLKSKIVGLVCDRDCNAIEIAKKNKIPFSILRPKDYAEKNNYIKELISITGSYSPDIILLAGYMRIIPSELLDEYPLKIINIHPSLLPLFKGKDAIKQAWDAGVKETGVTVHFVNDRMDDGLIILQKKVAVPNSLEELEHEIHVLEHKMYVEAVNLVSDLFIVVSKCLIGENIRYDGSNKLSKRIYKYVNGYRTECLLVCPEVLAGLGVPRSKINIINTRLISEDGVDLTDVMKRTCKDIIEKIPQNKMVLAILKDKSPSCGKTEPQGLLVSMLREHLKDRLLLLSETEI